MRTPSHFWQRARGMKAIRRWWLVGMWALPAWNVVEAQVDFAVEQAFSTGALSTSSVATTGIAVTVVLGPRGRPVAKTPIDCATLQERALALIDTAFCKVRYRYRFSPVLVVELRARQPLDALEAAGILRSAHLDLEGGGALDESRALVRADAVFALGITGEGRVVAVLDSGVDLGHPDLAAAVIGEQRFLDSGGDVGADAQDDHGHGTNVTGIVAGRGGVAPRGLAPSVSILAVKVLNSHNRGNLSDWAAGVEYVVNLHEEDNGIVVDAINMSLVSDQVYSKACDDVLPSFSAACIAARERGISLFASSGNGRNRDAVTLPACYSAVVAVGATSDTPPGLLADFTNRNELVELVAPGANVAATALGGGTSSFSGTSQASPHCAAAAALLREVDPKLSVEFLLEILTKTGVPIEDTSTGLTFPRIDVKRAVCALGPGEDCNGNDRNDVRDIFVEGTSVDCNSNDVPDECDIASEQASDCNLNGVPDACEISAVLEFRQGFRQAVGGLPIDVVAVDFDGDQALDIAVADGEEGFVGILYGDGTAGFSLPILHAAGEGPRALSVADLDGDLRPDLIIADGLAPSIAVLRNGGKRLFELLPKTMLGFAPVTLAAGDLDGDQHVDVVTAGGREGQVTILRGDGAGYFLTPRELQAGESPTDLLLVDVNADDRLDLVVGSRVPSALFLFVQDEFGEFGSGVKLLTPGVPRSLVAVDVNEDSLLDLAVAYDDRSEASVFVNASGWFLEPDTYGLVAPALDMVAADLNEDGRSDLVAVAATASLVSVLLGIPGGLREPALAVATAETPARLAVGDFDADGVRDLVVVHGRSGDVTVQLNRTGGPPLEDRDGNGVLDVCERRLVRGDCDGAGDGMTVTDAVFLVNFNFLGRAQPPCLAACDVDGDGVVRGVLTDVIYHLNFLFRGGPPPVPPFPGCTPLGPRDEEVGCERDQPDCG